MALINDLQEVGKAMPTSHVPTVTEVCNVVGALIAYVEHGSQVFDVVKEEAEKFSNLLAGNPPVVVPIPGSTPPTTSSVTDPQVATLTAQNEALKQQLETALAAIKTLQANQQSAPTEAVSNPPTAPAA